MTENTPKQPRIIKRYGNRKLYDCTDSCYVTLQELSQLVEKNEQIQVIDNSSKNDITKKTIVTLILLKKEQEMMKEELPKLISKLQK